MSLQISKPSIFAFLLASPGTREQILFHSLSIRALSSNITSLWKPVHHHSSLFPFVNFFFRDSSFNFPCSLLHTSLCMSFSFYPLPSVIHHSLSPCTHEFIPKRSFWTMVSSFSADKAWASYRLSPSIGKCLKE